MMVEMTSDENSGWFHNKFFKHVEPLWEEPLSWVCRFLCLELRKENYKRRVVVRLDNAERKIVQKNERDTVL